MKKSDIALILGVIVVIVISIFAFSSNSEKIETPVVLSDNFIGVQSIGYSDYNTMLEEEKTFILVVGREGCSYCDEFAPIMDEVSNENGIPVYEVDIATFTEDEMTEFTESNSVLKRGDWGTPTTLVLKGSEVVDSLAGYTEKESLIDFLNENVKVEETTEDTDTEDTEITEDTTEETE